MFQHKKLDELALMYTLFRRVESTLKYIIQKMAPYIEGRGQKIVGDEALLKDPIEFTKKLLDFKQEMDEMIEKSFLNDIKFQKNRDVSFQNFMNMCQFTPHYIASFTDNEFKKGLKGVSELETNARLDAIIRLFCCLHGRDVFIKAYTKHLSSRLLNKSSLSVDSEQMMLQKLKVECGHNTVNKLSQMFTDMNVSKDLM
jgi:cullin 3